VSISLLSIVGDAMWILAMATIASGSQRFWKQLPADVRVPMQWSLKRAPAWRAGRPLAFGLAVGAPLVLGLALSAAVRDPSNTPSEVLLLFLMRAFTAPLCVLIHHGWIRAATATLEAEGALKP
jgi:hypothetical protein